MQKAFKMIATLVHGYSSESTQAKKIILFESCNGLKK